MDFVTGLPRSKGGYDSIWVIVDRLTKTAHFLPVKTTYTTDRYARIYVDEVVRLHGAPVSIVSDRNPKFTSRFWVSLQQAMGTALKFSTVFHPQTDGQSERTIQTLEDMLRACVLDFKGSWDEYLALMEFAYNNSYHSSIGMPPYEALYGRRCRTPICWNDVGERQMFNRQLEKETDDEHERVGEEMLGPKLVQQTVNGVKLIRERLKIAQDRQKSYADKRRRDLEFEVGDRVFIRVSPWKGVVRFKGKKKLAPRYIGPYEIIGRVGATAYRLALPAELARLHDVFHVSMLRKYMPDPTHVLGTEPIELKEDLTYVEEPTQILDRGERVLRSKVVPLVKVQWRNHAREEATWETEETMRKNYPQLFGSGN